MRILIVNKHLEDEIGGSEVQCNIIARHLKAYGHEVIYGAVKSRRPSYNCSYEVVPLKKLNFRSLRRTILETRPDLVYWRYNKKSLLVAGILCKLYGLKMVFSISHINDTKKWSHKSVRLGERIQQLISGRINYLGYRFVDGVVSLRKDLAESVPSYRTIKKTVIYNSMTPELSGSFQWDRPYIFWVATIKKPKQPELFIKAAERLADKPFDFLMVGRIFDDSYSYIKEGTGLPANFHYLGMKTPNEVNTILRSSLFLVHTCHHEGFSNNFIQAWLQEKPTISLSFDPDGFIEGHGIGYCSGSFDRMCAQIVELFENEELRRQMGIRARDVAERLFRPDINVKAYEQFFKSILGTRGMRESGEYPI